MTYCYGQRTGRGIFLSASFTCNNTLYVIRWTPVSAIRTNKLPSFVSLWGWTCNLPFRVPDTKLKKFHDTPETMLEMGQNGRQLFRVYSCWIALLFSLFLGKMDMSERTSVGALVVLWLIDGFDRCCDDYNDDLDEQRWSEWCFGDEQCNDFIFDSSTEAMYGLDSPNEFMEVKLRYTTGNFFWISYMIIVRLTCEATFDSPCAVIIHGREYSRTEKVVSTNPIKPVFTEAAELVTSPGSVPL